MQDPERDIIEVVRCLLSGSISEREKVIDNCFTPDAVLTHDLVLLRGRREIFDVYQYWHDLYLKISFRMPKIVVSPHKDRMVLDFDEFLTPLLLPFTTVLARLVVFLELQRTPTGYKISCQEDHILWMESARKNFPTFNYFYETYVRRVTGLGIVSIMQAAGVTCRYLSLYVLPKIPYLKDDPKLSAKLRAIDKAFNDKLMDKWVSQGPNETFDVPK